MNAGNMAVSTPVGAAFLASFGYSMNQMIKILDRIAGRKK